MQDDKETRKRREVVAGMYTAPKWKTQVAKMPIHQITAIYLRMQSEEAPRNKAPQPDEPKKPDQLRLDL